MSLESVLANLTAYGIGVDKACESAMDRHIKSSVSFARTNHRWNDQTGAATSSIQSKTDSKGTEIESVIYGDIMTNLYLERAWFFNDRYAIIEKARDENISRLWAEIRAILGGGGLFGRFKSWSS